MDSALTILAKVHGAVAVVLFTLLTMVVSLQVFTRFVLETPAIWSEEVARFLFFWTVLLGAAQAVRSRRHFVIDIYPRRDHSADARWIRIAANAIPDLAVLGFSVFLLLEGMGYAELGTFRTGTNSRVNMGFVYAAIPVFAVLTILYSIGNVVADVRMARSGRWSPTPHPPAD